MLRRLVPTAALLALYGCSERPREADQRTSPSLLIVPSDADADLERLSEEARTYLGQVTGEPPRVEFADD